MTQVCQHWTEGDKIYICVDCAIEIDAEQLDIDTYGILCASFSEEQASAILEAIKLREEAGDL
jgi:hypothetical protein